MNDGLEKWLKVKRELKQEVKKVCDLKVQLMNSEQNRASQVRTLTDRIVHLERELASLQEQKAVTTFSFILTVALLQIHLIHTMALLNFFEILKQKQTTT